MSLRWITCQGLPGRLSEWNGCRKEKVQTPPMVVSNTGSVSIVFLTYSDSHPFSLLLPFANHPLSATSLNCLKLNFNHTNNS